MTGRAATDVTRAASHGRPGSSARRPRRLADLVLGLSQGEWSEEVRALLERRLKAVSVLSNVASLGFVANLFLVSGLGARMTALEKGAVLASTAWVLVSAVLVFATRRPSLPMLRGVESSVLVATFAALFVWGHGWLAHGEWLAGGVAPDVAGALRERVWAASPGDGGSVLHVRAGGSLLGQRIVLTWGLLAVLYGVSIPNTWRRCAAVMALVVLLPLACEVTAALDSEAFRPQLGAVLFGTAYMMTAFAGVGLYGCHKLDVLRRAAFDAQQVGQYKLVREIGRGGMGAVYLAEHRHLRRPCAVKVIREDEAREGQVARFEREVQAMARLTHPNTVEVYDYGRADDGTFFYAMEYLPGMTLEELVHAAGPLPPGRVIHLLRQACGALAEAHGLGLIHRDVKPANLFVCERGGVQDFVKILDFGIVQDLSVGEPASAPETAPSPEGDAAPVAGKLTLAGVILGTPAYVSPEQVRGEPADARSDVYALGGVALFLLTGAGPFPGSKALDLCAAHLWEPAPRASDRRPDVPADLDAVVARCLAKDAAERFQGAAQLEAALGACGDAGAWGSEQAAAWWAGRAERAASAARVAAAPTVRAARASSEREAHPAAAGEAPRQGENSTG